MMVIHESALSQFSIGDLSISFALTHTLWALQCKTFSIMACLSIVLCLLMFALHVFDRSSDYEVCYLVRVLITF